MSLCSILHYQMTNCSIGVIHRFQIALINIYLLRTTEQSHHILCRGWAWGYFVSKYNVTSITFTSFTSYLWCHLEIKKNNIVSATWTGTAWTHHPGLMMRYLPSTDRLTTVDPRRLWSPIGPPSTTTASLGHSSWNSFREKTQEH